MAEQPVERADYNLAAAATLNIGGVNGSNDLVALGNCGAVTGHEGALEHTGAPRQK